MAMAMISGAAADYGTGQERRESTNRPGRRPGRRARARQKARRQEARLHGAAYGRHMAGASIVTDATPHSEGGTAASGSREWYGQRTAGASIGTAATPRAEGGAASAGDAGHSADTGHSAEHSAKWTTREA